MHRLMHFVNVCVCDFIDWSTSHKWCDHSGIPNVSVHLFLYFSKDRIIADFSPLIFDHCIEFSVFFRCVLNRTKNVVALEIAMSITVFAINRWATPPPHKTRFARHGMAKIVAFGYTQMLIEFTTDLLLISGIHFWTSANRSNVQFDAVAVGVFLGRLPFVFIVSLPKHWLFEMLFKHVASDIEYTRANTRLMCNWWETKNKKTAIACQVPYTALKTVAALKRNEKEILVIKHLLDIQKRYFVHIVEWLFFVKKISLFYLFIILNGDYIHLNFFEMAMIVSKIIYDSTYFSVDQMPLHCFKHRFLVSFLLFFWDSVVFKS